MITPFDEAGHVDFPLLEALTEWYIASGVAGLFAVCLSSEMFQLSDRERLRIAKCVNDKVAGRVKVVASGTFGGTVEEMAAFSLQMAEHCDAVVLISGLMAEETDDDEMWLANMRKFCSLTQDISLGVYECPLPYHRLLSPSMLHECATSGRFVFHKDTCCDVEQIKAKLEAIPRDSPLRFFNANVETLQASQRLGAHGFCGISANFYPWLHSRLCRQYEGEDADRIQDFLAVAENVVVVGYPRSSKVFLGLLGFPITETCRKPGVLELNDVKRRQIQAMYNMVGGLSSTTGGVEMVEAAQFINRR